LLKASLACAFAVKYYEICHETANQPQISRMENTMILLSDLSTFLDEYMLRTDATASIDPKMANGLQVRGKEEVRTIVTGVSASQRFFEQAVSMGADAMVVHHGLNLPASIHFDQLFVHRLRYLLDHELSLFGYHYLLDSHPEVGNNVQIIRQLGGTPSSPYGPDGWGWIGEISNGADRDDLLKRCAQLFSQEGIQYPFGPRRVRRVVALSGSGAPRSGGDMDWLQANEVDLYVTGEPREWTREYCREAGISFVAGGHYHTERIGIQSLTQVLTGRWDGVTVRFLDLPNSV
jgi:dinuclear metal center YbgI/SA1388 family protein